jgi:hypothetical protein
MYHTLHSRWSWRRPLAARAARAATMHDMSDRTQLLTPTSVIQLNVERFT